MEQKHLKKEINLVGALSTVMGTVIGAGVFFKVASVVNHTQNASATLFAWALGGLLTICGGLTVAELATAIPKRVERCAILKKLMVNCLHFYSVGRK